MAIVDGNSVKTTQSLFFTCDPGLLLTTEQLEAQVKNLKSHCLKTVLTDITAAKDLVKALSELMRQFMQLTQEPGTYDGLVVSVNSLAAFANSRHNLQSPINPHQLKAVVDLIEKLQQIKPPNSQQITDCYQQLVDVLADAHTRLDNLWVTVASQPTNYGTISHRDEGAQTAPANTSCCIIL